LGFILTFALPDLFFSVFYPTIPARNEIRENA
jgi:hypothetical protein